MTMATGRGEYRPIYVALLDGPDFQLLRPEERWVLVALKLSLGMTGIKAAPGLAAAIAERTGYSLRIVRRGMDRLEAAKWLRREKNVAWLIRGLEFEPGMTPTNRKHRSNVQRQIDALPRLPIVDDFRMAYPQWFIEATGYPFDTPSDTHGEPPRITDTDPRTDNRIEKDTERAAHRTQPGIGDGADLQLATQMSEHVRELIPESYRYAFDGFRRAARNPFAFLKELEAIASGQHPPAYEWPTIGRALHELTAAGAPCTPKTIRAFCRSLVAEQEPPVAAPGIRGSRLDEYEVAARRLEAEASHAC